MPKPLLNYSPNFENTNISTLKFEYNVKDFNVVFGSIYEQFGSGTSLRTWEDKSLGINNSLLGLNVNYKLTDEINLTSLIGQQKKGFKYSKGFVFGLDSEIDISQLIDSNSTFLFGLSYVGRNDQEIKSESFDNLTNLYSARIDYSGNSFYTNLEITQKSNNPILVFGTPSDTFIKKGSAYLLNTGFFNKGLGLDFTFRRLENMTLYSEIAAAGNEFNESIVNYLPALTKQHDYSLTNLYVYAAQPDVNFYVEDLTKAGEIGFQFEFYVKLKKNSFFGGKTGADLNINISNFNNLSGDFSFEEKSYDLDFLNFGQTYFSEQSVNLTKDFSNNFSSIFVFINRYYNKRLVEQSTGKVNSKIIVIDNIFNINDTQSIEFDIQHLFNTNDKKNWFGTGVEYNLNFKNSIFGSYSNNYGNNKQKSFYYNLGVSRTIKNGLFSISYGKQRGGIACFGGICKYYPEYTGVSGTLSLNF